MTQGLKMFVVKFVSEKSNDEFLAPPTKLKAKMAQMILLLEKFGKLGEPHTKNCKMSFLNCESKRKRA